MKDYWQEQANTQHQKAIIGRIADSDDWDDDQFFNTGKQHVDEFVIPHFERIGKDPSKLSVLEIGCGAGRMTHHLAGIFSQTYAVDIASEMVQRASKAAPDAKVQLVTDGFKIPLESSSIDFCFSYLVFQHIPSTRILDGYMNEVARVLKPGGQFRLHYRDAHGNWLRRTATNILSRSRLSNLLGRSPYVLGLRLPSSRFVPRFEAAGLSIDSIDRNPARFWLNGHKKT